MAPASNMPPEVEARIRALPGNNVCMDCQNVNPQWASVTYGALMCLECSGQHRSLGVHLSFVRSVQMDSWTEKQIAAMERSGGNAAIVEFFSSRGIEKSMPVHQKYNTKQAAYYAERLRRQLEGKTEPPPDPGRYDPATGGSEAQGAEPLPGETTEEYNARQARLREAARARLQAKFGGGGMGGVGSSNNTASGGFQDDDDWGTGLGGAVGAVTGIAGNVATGVGSFLSNKVVNNEDLHSSIRGAAGSAMETGTSAWSSLRQTVAEGDLVESLKRNATLQDGSVASKGLGWGLSTASSLWGAAASGIGSMKGVLAEDASSPTVYQGPTWDSYGLRIAPEPDGKCSFCGVIGTRYANYEKGTLVCTKCYDKPPPEPEKDEPPPPEVTSADMDRIARELGMDLKGSSPSKPQPKTSPSASPTKSQDPSSPPTRTPAASPASSPTSAEPKPKAKEKDKLGDPDDFFSEFGLN